MIRLSVLMCAFLLTLVGAVTSDASVDEQPKRVSPIYVVPTGHGTVVRVWKTTNGYCVLAYGLQLVDRAFCISRISLANGGPMFACLCRQRHGTSLVIGTVKPSVRRGAKTDRQGVAPVQLFSAPEGLDTSLRFFRTVVRSGSPPKWRVQFYDRRGHVAGMIGQGY